jgi:hypothetical protein
LRLNLFATVSSLKNVWVFSTAACGTYGLSNVKIASSGRTTPLGEVVLQSTKNISIRGGSGWLLIAVGQPVSL